MQVIFYIMAYDHNRATLKVTVHEETPTDQTDASAFAL